MPDWDPYYLARGMFRERPEAQTERGRARYQRVHEENQDRRERAEQRNQFAEQATSALSEHRVILKAQLDNIEATNTAFLLENSDRLAASTKEIAALLAQAFVLDDGSRVFKSRDGAIIIDEFGEIVPEDIIDPDLIPAGGPAAEDYLLALEAKKVLEANRDHLLDRQRRIDVAHEKLDDDLLTGEELNALEAELGVIVTPVQQATTKVRKNPSETTPIFKVFQHDLNQ